jgi:hypothetical protein
MEPWEQFRVELTVLRDAGDYVLNGVVMKGRRRGSGVEVAHHHRGSAHGNDGHRRANPLETLSARLPLLAQSSSAGPVANAERLLPSPGITDQPQKDSPTSLAAAQNWLKGGGFSCMDPFASPKAAPDDRRASHVAALDFHPGWCDGGTGALGRQRAGRDRRARAGITHERHGLLRQGRDRHLPGRQAAGGHRRRCRAGLGACADRRHPAQQRTDEPHGERARGRDWDRCELVRAYPCDLRLCAAGPRAGLGDERHQLLQQVAPGELSERQAPARHRRRHQFPERPGAARGHNADSRPCKRHGQGDRGPKRQLRNLEPDRLRDLRQPDRRPRAGLPHKSAQLEQLEGRGCALPRRQAGGRHRRRHQHPQRPDHPRRGLSLSGPQHHRDGRLGGRTPSAPTAPSGPRPVAGLPNRFFPRKRRRGARPASRSPAPATRSHRPREGGRW